MKTHTVIPLFPTSSIWMRITRYLLLLGAISLFILALQLKDGYSGWAKVASLFSGICALVHYIWSVYLPDKKTSSETFAIFLGIGVFTVCFWSSIIFAVLSLGSVVFYIGLSLTVFGVLFSFLFRWYYKWKHLV